MKISVTKSYREMALPLKEQQQQQHFPHKLYGMLEYAADVEYSSAVSWVEEGQAFAIHKKETFLEHIVPRFFNQTKFRSFTRQLNLWGFTRISNEGPDGDGGAWKHEHFIRGRFDRISFIERKEGKKSKSSKTKSRHLIKSKLEEHRTKNSTPTWRNKCTVTKPTLSLETTNNNSHSIFAFDAFNNDMAGCSSIPKEHLYSPPIINFPQNALLAQPLVPNKVFMSHIIQHQTIWPCVTTPQHIHLQPVLPSSCPAPLKTQHNFISNTNSITDSSQLPLTPPSNENNMVQAQKQNAMQQPPPVVDGGNEEDVLFMLSGMIGFESDESSQSDGLSSILSLDEVSEDFLNPISFGSSLSN